MSEVRRDGGRSFTDGMLQDEGCACVTLMTTEADDNIRSKLLEGLRRHSRGG